jgi:hypothetical protein
MKPSTDSRLSIYRISRHARKWRQLLCTIVLWLPLIILSLQTHARELDPRGGPPAPPSSPMTFRSVSNGGNCNGCEWIAAEGRITADTAAAFRRFAGGRGFTHVSLHSDGGDPLAAMELGREFRSLRITTSIGRTIPDAYGWHTNARGRCFSACAIAFLGGVVRHYAPDRNDSSRLGFHQISFSREPASAASMSRFEGMGYGLSAGQILSGLLIDYAVGMGIDSRVVTLSGRTSPHEMWILTASEAVALKVDNSKLSDQPDWRLSVIRSGLILAGPGTMYPDHAYQAALLCARGRPGWLQIEISVGLGVDSWDPTHLNQSLSVSGGRIGRHSEDRITLPMLPARVQGRQMMSTILLPPPAVSLLRAGGLSISYNAPRVYLNVLPWMQITGPIVVDTVDLLLRNCPA